MFAGDGRDSLIMLQQDFKELCRLLRIEKERYEFRMAGCAGKQKFDTPAMAHHSTRAMSGNASAFKCGFCGKWHVGSGIRPKGKR